MVIPRIQPVPQPPPDPPSLLMDECQLHNFATDDASVRVMVAVARLSTMRWDALPAQDREGWSVIRRGGVVEAVSVEVVFG